MVTDDYNGVWHKARWNRGVSVKCWFNLNMWIQLITYPVQDECWSNWGGFSASGNRCYKAQCGNPKRGHLVTLQMQHKAEIKEFVVLNSECKVSTYRGIQYKLEHFWKRQRTTNHASSQQISETFLGSRMDTTQPAGKRVPIVLSVPQKWNIIK